MVLQQIVDKTQDMAEHALVRGLRPFTDSGALGPNEQDIFDYPHRIFFLFPLDPRGPFEIPVPPATITAPMGQILGVRTLLALGEVATPGGQKLRRFSFESHFPGLYDDSIEVVTEAKHIEPRQWVDMIDQTQRNQLTAHVTVMNTPIDWEVTIATFNWGIEAGPPGDIWYQIELAEKREGMIREHTGLEFPVAANRPLPLGTLPRSVTVREGETLQDVAKRVYGTSFHWNELYLANERTITANVDSVWITAEPLPSGITLIVPEPEYTAISDFAPSSTPQGSLAPISDSPIPIP